MNNLSTIKIFLQVADDGSFSATARRRNMSVSSIARQISGLEERIGVRLLNRTTRHHSLTEVGKIYYQRMKQLLSEFENINDTVISYHSSARGTLRVHLRSSVARIVIPQLKRFQEKFPDIVLEITLTEDRVDLVSEGVDVAVWLGNIEDSNYIARRLTGADRIVVGSRAYLEGHPKVEKLEDLQDHQCIVYSRAAYARDIWRFIKDNETFDIPVKGNLRTRSGWALYNYVMNNLGLAMIQKWMIVNELHDGSVVRLLPEYSCNSVEQDLPLFVVYPHSQMLPTKSRAFIDFLVEVFQEHLREV